MENPDQTEPRPEPAAPGQSDQPKPRPKRNQPKRSPRNNDGGDFNRQRPRSDRSAMFGFGDEVDRAFCAGIVSRPPRAYPVQHRTGVSVVTPVVVARRTTSLLFCDCEHTGPHIWPNGDVVGEEDVSQPLPQVGSQTVNGDPALP